MKIQIRKYRKGYRLTQGKFISTSDSLLQCSGIMLMGIGRFLLVIRPKPNPYTRTRRFFKRQLPQFIKGHSKVFKLWVREVVLRKPIYFEYFSRDCDCVEVSGYGIAKDRKDFAESQQAMWENAEGTCWMKRCSKSEYMRYGGQEQTRDRVMEAYENGRGTCVNI